MRRIRLLLAVVAGVALLTGACGDDSEVGAGLDDEGLDGGSGPRLGEATTTVATTAPPVTAAPVTTAPAAPVTTRPPATTAPPTVALEIKIQGDTQGSQFEPRLGQVRSGSIVKWVNVDSQARSVVADNGAFRSPSIPPGGSWELRAPAPGTYNYTDGTRPYAVAQLQVV
jgi:plastocyanin